MYLSSGTAQAWPRSCFQRQVACRTLAAGVKTAEGRGRRLRTCLSCFARSQRMAAAILIENASLAVGFGGEVS